MTPDASDGAEIPVEIPVTEFTISGALIVANRTAFRQNVLDALEGGARRFVLDLSECGYIDASGLGVLVSIAKRIRELGGRLVLSGLNDDLATLLELSRIATLFTVVSTRDEALALVRNPDASSSVSSPAVAA